MKKQLFCLLSLFLCVHAYAMESLIADKKTKLELLTECVHCDGHYEPASLPMHIAQTHSLCPMQGCEKFKNLLYLSQEEKDFLLAFHFSHYHGNINIDEWKLKPCSKENFLQAKTEPIIYQKNKLSLPHKSITKKSKFSIRTKQTN